jgi:hypothetical protein
LIWSNAATELAYDVEAELFRRGLLTHVIAPQTDGSMLLELVRNSLEAGLVTICSAGLFYEVEKGRAQQLVPGEQFIDFDASARSGETETVIERGLLASRLQPGD